jgi:hypothetical protein
MYESEKKTGWFLVEKVHPQGHRPVSNAPLLSLFNLAVINTLLLATFTVIS